MEFHGKIRLKQLVLITIHGIIVIVFAIVTKVGFCTFGSTPTSKFRNENTNRLKNKNQGCLKRRKSPKHSQSATMCKE